LCRVKSGVDGLFVFPSVPSGEYTLVMKSNTVHVHTRIYLIYAE